MIGPVLLFDPDSGGLPLCDVDDSTKKRKSVTTRNSENCPDPFVEKQMLKIIVLRVDGINNLNVEVTHNGDSLGFTTV